MKTYNIIYLLFLGISTVCYSQSQDQNYIRTRTYMSTDTTKRMDQIQYYDGLGRANQTVQVGITPNKKDIVIIQEYDEFSRESNVWLPGYGSGNGAYTDPVTVKNSVKTLNLNDQSPYSKPVYEASPLNRVIEQYGPGADWHQDYSATKGKAVRSAYKTNISGDAILNCILYVAGGTSQSPTLAKSGNYATGELFVTEIKDENENVSYEFKDKLGQVVLTRQINSGVNHDTYYVYNDFGNLCYVLPPRINDEGITQTKLNELAYQYKYDHRKRCTWKKLPGADEIYYVYDKADQLIFTQDGEQRNKSPNEWTFSIPDAFGRIVLAGICKDTISVSNKVVKGVYSSTGSYKRYTIQVDGVNKQFTNTPSILSVNFYDNYDFRGMAEIPSSGTDYTTETGFNTRYTGGYKGLLTASLTAQYKPDGTISSDYLYSVMYYDNRGRVIQTKSNNHLAGGTEAEYIAYDFVGNPTQRKTVHTATGKTTQTEVYTYTYDHAGRLLTTTHQLNSGTTTTLATNTYDELGRLKENKKANHDWLNTVYKYNVRSWIKSMMSYHLHFNLDYDYNGNIKTQSWTQGGQIRKYDFTYDGLSRLTKADFTGATNEKFATSYYYDKHGNIQTLQRYGRLIGGSTASSYGLVDNLTMDYIGNQLIKAHDVVATIAISESEDFKNYTTQAVEYTYNKNGAMTKDLNKGISQIQYNSLNLPRQIDVKSPVGEGRNEYLYSASGVKLQVIQRYNSTYNESPVIGSDINPIALDKTKTTDYVANKIYEDGELKRILVDGGYYDAMDKKYYFYLTDHLGNNRMVMTPSGGIIQQTQYYPFGSAFTWSTAEGAQPYKYNGKELDKMHGLNMYDYSARHYDAAIGRFTTIDPHAENYYSTSPYAYVLNNPLKFIDPLGTDTVGLNPQGEIEWILPGGDDITYGSAPTTTVTPKNEIGESDEANVIFPWEVMLGINYLVKVPEKVSGRIEPMGFDDPIFLILTGRAFYRGATATVTSVATKKAYSEATYQSFKRILRENGRKSLEKSKSKIERRLAEHQDKLPDLKHKSSVEREINTFKSQLEAINDILKGL